MRILLDECLPVGFRYSFPNHETHSAEWAGLKGKKNGELLHAAEAGGYQVLLIDYGISRQQTTTCRSLAIILIRSRTNQLEDLLPLAPAITNLLESIHPGQVAVIPSSV